MAALVQTGTGAVFFLDSLSGPGLDTLAKG